MRHQQVLGIGGIVVLATGVLLAAGSPSAQQKTPVSMPQPGVPQVMTLEGEYVRIAYNNEGYVSLGYRIANDSVGEPWIMLEIGTTVRAGVPAYKLTRSAITLDTPDAKAIPLPTNEEYRAVDLRSQEMRAKTVVDTIGYFPPEATQSCAITFFTANGGGRAFDDVELECEPRLPGPALFQSARWAQVRPALAEREVPEQRGPRTVPHPDRGRSEDPVKTWKDIKKQVDEAFKKGGRGGN